VKIARPFLAWAVVTAILCVVHEVSARWLAGSDPIARAIGGHATGVVAIGAPLALSRFLLFFVVPPWFAIVLIRRIAR
jgi:hypothetical protein